MPISAAVAVPHPPLIMPEVGKGEEKKIRATTDAYRKAMRFLASFQPETVIVLSPHATVYKDYFHISPGMRAHGDFMRFQAPEITIDAKYDLPLVSMISKLAKESHIEAGTLGEREPQLDHAVMIPLRFLEEEMQGFSIVRIGLSGLTPLMHYRFGECIKKAVDKLNRRCVVIASGDLSHRMAECSPYGFVKEGPAFDKLATNALDTGDFNALLSIDPKVSEAAAECGLRSYLIMAGALDGKAVESKLLSYEGPFGVGYAVATFQVTGDDDQRRFGDAFEESDRKAAAERKANEDEYVRLARLAVETFVNTRRRAKLPGDLPEALSGQTAGVFVTLYEGGKLRGCIGTISPMTDSVAEEIFENAVSAATCDPRFAPVGPNELSALVYSVDVMGEPESVSSAADLDPAAYGVIVEAGEKRGLLLPDLEGVDTAADQIAIAREKAGITPVENVKLFRFTVTRHQ